MKNVRYVWLRGSLMTPVLFQLFCLAFVRRFSKLTPPTASLSIVIIHFKQGVIFRASLFNNINYANNFALLLSSCKYYEHVWNVIHLHDHLKRIKMGYQMNGGYSGNFKLTWLMKKRINLAKNWHSLCVGKKNKARFYNLLRDIA